MIAMDPEPTLAGAARRGGTSSKASTTEKREWEGFDSESNLVGSGVDIAVSIVVVAVVVIVVVADVFVCVVVFVVVWGFVFGKL